MDPELVEEIRAARLAVDAREESTQAALGARGFLSARERIARTVDGGTFRELGMLAAARAVGAVVGGLARIHGEPVMIASYEPAAPNLDDPRRSTSKIDRLIRLAEDSTLPLILFVGDADGTAADGGVRSRTLPRLAQFSGHAPIVVVVAGVCVGRHASIVGAADIVAATEQSTIDVHTGEPTAARSTPSAPQPNVEALAGAGVVDMLVADDAEAVEAVRRLLSCILVAREPGGGEAPTEDPAAVVPDNRRRAYDMRKLIDGIGDRRSVLELRPRWGVAVVTTFARIGGRAVGLMGSQPLSPTGGAVDADAADKIARFVRLCDAYRLPIVSLVDNPGYMAGPDAERAGIGRRHPRPLFAHHHRTVPVISIQVRKAYGLGPHSMSGRPTFRFAWPSVESGGMGLEGAANIVLRDKLANASPAEARAMREEYAAKMRRGASGAIAGQSMAFDEILYPSEARDAIVECLAVVPEPPPSRLQTRYLDPW